MTKLNSNQRKFIIDTVSLWSTTNGQWDFHDTINELTEISKRGWFNKSDTPIFKRAVEWYKENKS